MKMGKKVATLLLAVCLLVSCFSIMTFAANRIMFEDPSTAVGETLRLKGVIESDTDLEDRQIQMTYDTAKLKFISGDDVTESTSGQLIYKATGKVGGKRVEFYMNFEVLQEGTATVQVTSQKIYNTSNSLVSCQTGSSTVTIAAGEEVAEDSEKTNSSETENILVNGTSYTLSEEFSENEIPTGFEETTMDYDGADRRVVVNDITGMYLGYLVNEEGEGSFFVYVSEDATFAPFVQIDISDSTSIVLLTTVEDITLPDYFQATTINVNGAEFPAWLNTQDTRFCVLYAINNQGASSLYQFDTMEETYQRFEAPDVEEEETDSSMMGQLVDLLENHLDYVILGTGLGFILFILIIIILSVKLYNRNAELDELYDEYGIDLDDEEEETEDMFIKIDDSVLDDVLLDDEDENGDEIEVEFFEEPKEPEEPTKEFKVEAEPVETDEKPDTEAEPEETDEKPEAEAEPEETVAEPEPVETSEKDVVKDIAKEINDDSFYDDEDDDDFEVDFIDLDD